MTSTLKILPLGGLGEIGMNCMILQYESEIIIIDCGLLFSDLDHFGVEFVIPDFSWLQERKDQVRAVFLTHGHEDHIGAVPYLLRERGDIPVYGSKLTLALTESKLKEHRITGLMREIADGEKVKIGSFEVEAVAVNHSIPHALALAIKCGAGTVLHTGDFKMDQLPLDPML